MHYYNLIALQLKVNNTSGRRIAIILECFVCQIFLLLYMKLFVLFRIVHGL